MALVSRRLAGPEKKRLGLGLEKKVLLTALSIPVVGSSAALLKSDKQAQLKLLQKYSLFSPDHGICVADVFLL
jgi:hypothetical protein